LQAPAGAAGTGAEAEATITRLVALPALPPPPAFAHHLTGALHAAGRAGIGLGHLAFLLVAGILAAEQGGADGLPVLPRADAGGAGLAGMLAARRVAAAAGAAFPGLALMG